MTQEREHWLNVTKDPDYKVKYIHDPSISLEETLKAITDTAPESVKNILEIGCGYGRLTIEMKKIFSKATIVGFDINKELLKEASKINQGIQPRIIYTDEMPGPGQDLIYSVAVFQHLRPEQKQDYIKQAYDLLATNGVLTIQYISGERNNFLDHWETDDNLLDWFRESGFNLLSIRKGLAHKQWSWISGVKND